MNKKEIFETIYEKSVWVGCPTNNITRSGEGSTIDNTVEILKFLEERVKEFGIKKIVDMGCGDTNWIRHAIFFKISKYKGVDISEWVINENRKAHPRYKFFVDDVSIKYPKGVGKCDLIIMRDMLFHNSVEDVSSILENIKGKFKYLAVTNGVNEENTDDFDSSHWTPRNLNIDPFNLKKPLYSIKEDYFNRTFDLYDHENVYN